MEWVTYSTLNWIIFFLLVDWKTLKKNMLGGFLAIAFACIVDSHKVQHEAYYLKNLILELHETSVFFLLGPAFVIGTLIVQYHPAKRWLVVVNVFVFTGFFTAMEYTLVEIGVIEYIHWHYYDSIIINFAAFFTLSWFSIVVMNKKINQN